LSTEQKEPERTFEGVLEDIQKRFCTCDVMYGYECSLHTLLAELRGLCKDGVLTDNKNFYPKEILQSEFENQYCCEPYLPVTMSPEMMKRLLGGSFPDTGFAWEAVEEFRLENGVWEPYNGFGEILPANGFRINVDSVDMNEGITVREKD